jgi:serine/threonine protein kinase
MLARELWRDLEGQLLDEKIRVLELLSADRDGIFAAEPVEGSEFEPLCPIVVRFIRENGRGEPLLDRFLEASFLDHPNLQRCFGAGTFERGSLRFTYVVMERGDVSLAEYIRTLPLPPEEARKLGLELAAGLSYLHQRNLVYCNLDAPSVARVGESWKLSDFSQMRVAGNTYVAETRRLMAVTPNVPPEAYEGVVTPSWDAWSLACVLTTAVSGRKSEDSLASRRPKPDLPAPFASITAECLNSNPQERCGIDRVRQLLEHTANGNGSGAQEPLKTAAPDATPPQSAATPPANEPEPTPAPVAVRTSRQIDLAMHPYEAARERARTRRSGRNWIVYAVATAAALAILIAVFLIRNPRTQGRPAPAAPKLNSPSSNAPTQPKASGTRGESDRTTAAPVKPPDDQAAIRSLLENWAAASRSGNVDQQANFYAPIVDRYYGQRNVTRDRIKREREQALEKLGAVRQYDISNVYVQITGVNTAIATFNKTWNFASPSGSYSGKVRQQVSLRKMDGSWWIAAERDIRVYRRSRRDPSRS